MELEYAYICVEAMQWIRFQEYAERRLTQMALSHTRVFKAKGFLVQIPR